MKETSSDWGQALHPGDARAGSQSSESPDGAAGNLDGARQRVAEKVQGAANALRGSAERLYGSERISEGVADLAQAAADRIESSATYLESHNLKQMAQDLGSVVKRYPTRSLLIAAAVGFLCSRALLRGDRTHGGHDQHATGSRGGGGHRR